MATLTNVISNATGNVGIGTISPTRKLDVNGDGYFASTLYIADNTALNLGNTSQIYHNSARASTQFTGTSGANTMCIKDSDGNVGIGTTGPVAKLHVSGSGQTVIRVEASTTTNVAVFAAKADTDAALIMGMYGGSGVGNQFGVSAARQAFIGTTSYSTVHPTSLVIGNVSNIPIAFSTDNTERMRITSGGNVGIGTTSPSQALHILTSNSGNNGLTIATTSATGNPQIRFLNSAGAEKAAITYASSANAVYFYTDASASNLMNFVGANVGIGTTAPAVKLDVVGNIRTSTGILFGTDTAAANLLDDYEEGTWTPVYSPTAGAFTTMPSVGSGKYRKIGDTVFFWIDLRTVGTVVLGTASGDIQITGFPFTCSAAGGYGASSIFQQFNLAAAFTNLGIIITGSTTIARITKNSSNTSVAYVQANELSTATGNYENLIGVIGMYNV